MAAGGSSTAFSALVLVWLCLTAAKGASDVTLGRRLLIRPFPQGPNSCRNTMQGPWYMTDDKGKVCPAKELDYTTGCCTAGEQHSCAMCNKVDSCCESFEHCVSCCMHPDNKPEERRKETPRVFHDANSGVWADVFEYCLATCRTHGRSTSHENAYIGPRHHCFSKLGKPMLSSPLPKGALDDVTVLLGASGASCSTVCQQKGLACSQTHLHFLNGCDRLREVTNCEAGCIEEQHTTTMPAAVDAEAPKASRPALCLVGIKAAESEFSCDATANYMRRLCSCVKAPEAPPTAATSSSSTESTGSASGAPASAAGSVVSSTKSAATEGPAVAANSEQGAADLDPAAYDDPQDDDGPDLVGVEDTTTGSNKR